MMSNLPDAGPCPICGRVRREWTTILATPVAGEFKGQLLHLKVEDIALFGFGHKLKQRVQQASWTSALLDGVIYGYSRQDGVIKTFASSLKSLETLLGGTFVSVEQGILVALRAILVSNLREHMVGVNVGDDDDRVIYHVVCSRRGAKRLESLLPHFDRRPDEAP